MAWFAEKKDNNPQIVLDVLKKHRLLPENLPYAAAMCNEMGAGHRFQLTVEGALRCEVFVSSVVPGEQASLVLVPVAEHFRHGYHEDFVEAFAPLFHDLFQEMDVRRINAAIPATRSRTKRALCVLGFSVEGRMKDAVKLHNEEPQDLRVLGLTKDAYFGQLTDVAVGE